MPPRGIIEALNVIEHVGFGLVSRAVQLRGRAFGFSEEKKRSLAALSQTLPARLILLGHTVVSQQPRARNGSAVGTLVERTTRLVILAKMNGNDATSARQGFTKKLRHVPASLRKTLTYDRGKVMAEHERLAERLAIQMFFADPYSPWQRGANEKYEWPAASVPAQGY